MSTPDPHHTDAPILCETTGLRRRLFEQFYRPHGPLGAVVGWIMARRASNRERNTWTVDLLDIQPDDRVLEVGFGPGLAVARAAALASCGLVGGVDHSPVMLRQATARNLAAITAGRVDLRLASAENVPEFGAPFDKLFAVNTLHFSHAPLDLLRSWQPLLRPGGTVAITFQPPALHATDEDALDAGRELVHALEQAGFEHVRLERRPMSRVMAVCVMGERPRR